MLVDDEVRANICDAEAASPDQSLVTRMPVSEMSACKLNYYGARVIQPLFPANKRTGLNISTRFVSWTLLRK
jgi:hypothetical protein